MSLYHGEREWRDADENVQSRAYSGSVGYFQNRIRPGDLVYSERVQKWYKKHANDGQMYQVEYPDQSVVCHKDVDIDCGHCQEVQDNNQRCHAMCKSTKTRCKRDTGSLLNRLCTQHGRMFRANPETFTRFDMLETLLHTPEVVHRPLENVVFVFEAELFLQDQGAAPRGILQRLHASKHARVAVVGSKREQALLHDAGIDVFTQGGPLNNEPPIVKLVSAQAANLANLAKPVALVFFSHDDAVLEVVRQNLKKRVHSFVGARVESFLDETTFSNALTRLFENVVV